MPGWTDTLKPGYAIVLAFNRYIPKRNELLSMLTELRLEDTGLTTEHRMSESIVRDLIVLRKS